MRRSCTGSSARAGAGLRIAGTLALLLGVVVAVAPAPAEAQALKLRSLRFPPTTVVGPWVSYRVLTQNKSRPGREYTQRVAVVARESYLGSEGFWVELKTDGLPSGTRIERGFFVEPLDEESAGRESDGATKRVRLVRYQVYTSGGKLYEYPIESRIETRAGADVSTLELFEYDPSIPPMVEELGPDTLRLGRRAVPSVVERTRRYGADQWAMPNDTMHVQRPVLTQTYWKNPAVPVTGFARSLFEVTTERWTRRAPGDSTASVPAPLGTPEARPPFRPKAGPREKPLSRTELILLDLGADAVPEVTIAPEIAHDDLPAGPGEPIRTPPAPPPRAASLQIPRAPADRGERIRAPTGLAHSTSGISHMASGGRRPLGQSLVEQGHLSPEGLSRALEEQRRTGSSLRDALLTLELVPEAAVLDYYEDQLGFPRMDLGTYVLEPEVVRLVPERVARQYNVVPLFKIGNSITVAMADPLDVVALDEVKQSTGLQVDVVVSPESQIREAVERYHPVDGMDLLARGQALRQAAAEAVAARPEEDGPIIRFVNAVVQQAVRDGASDLHFEPEDASFRIRCRVDGVLREVSIQAKSLYTSVVSRVKVLAALDISERRLPQDGRFRTQVLGRDFDVRVSTFPTIHGENVVLRLLDRSTALIGMEELGLAQGPLRILTRIVERPNGLVLVTGPTGSGKTTTLYACIHRINTVERNIVTLEDPVEYHLASIRQTQVDPDAGLTFARGLRALLRQDPDVILVGEIRDGDTAEIAVRSALTGHLVLSTLHTNDAAGAIPRLLDMGIEPFLLSSAVAGVVGQRLVRRVCERCREAADPPAELLHELGLDSSEGAFVIGRGCRACGGTGYRGRLGIFEVLEVNDDIRDLVSARASSDELGRAGRRAGMGTLREDAVRKAAKGMTTLAEVLRVTKKDSTAPAGPESAVHGS